MPRGGTEGRVMEKEREKQVYLARLAEQAERYDGINSFFEIFYCLLPFISISFWGNLFFWEVEIEDRRRGWGRLGWWRGKYRAIWIMVLKL